MCDDLMVLEFSFLKPINEEMARRRESRKQSLLFLGGRVNLAGNYSQLVQWQEHAPHHCGDLNKEKASFRSDILLLHVPWLCTGTIYPGVRAGEPQVPE